ncbi:MAG: cysteine desulfurase [Bacteroidales bacterium]|nr:cysteine desulfurase [Bacteroidales bacterium]
MNWKQNFPIFEYAKRKGQSLVYFDNAATTHKPFSVIEAEREYYFKLNSNIHRANHYLSQKSTDLFEETRDAVKNFIHASKREEIIFTRGTTESFNLLASSLLELFNPGDNIILTHLEHHSNIVPWQLNAWRKGIEIRVLHLTDEGIVDLDHLTHVVDSKTRLISVAHVSNVLGTIQPISEIAKYAHERNILVAVDGAQAVAHIPVNVQELDCDFYAFSAHKMYGPTGVGVLYGKEEWLQKLPPDQGGGEMIEEVSCEKTTLNALPYKFEAGTPNIAGVVSFKKALDFTQDLFSQGIMQFEEKLLKLALNKLNLIEGIILYGTHDVSKRTSVISFNHHRIHPYDLGILLDQMNVAVRTGNHCAQPLMKWLGLSSGTVRISFACYNDEEDIDRFIEGLKKVLNMLL